MYLSWYLIVFFTSFKPKLPVLVEVCVWLLSVPPMAECRHILACAPTGKWSHQEGTSICPHVFNCISFLVYEYISPKQSHRISFETKQPGNSCLKRGFRGSKLIRISVISWLLTKKKVSSFFSFRLISSQLVKVAKLLQKQGHLSL